MNGEQHQHAAPPSRQDLLAAALLKFPAMQKHAQDFAVVQGRPLRGADGNLLLTMPDGRPDDRQLESYAPDESWNPVPGKATTEIYNNTAPFDQQVALVAGDMLHHLPMVDPKWDAMKRDVLPPQLRDNPGLYRSTGDEFLMGAITPDKSDYWRGRPGTNLKSAYTPEQDVKLKMMARYLATGQTEAPK